MVDLPRLTTPTTKAAEPPAQGGTKILGTLVEHCVVTNWNAKILYANVMLSCGRNMFLGILTKGLTVLPPSTMRSRWLLHQCENHNVDWRIFLVPLSTFLQMWISRASTMIWPRPSSLGSASELTILTCCISEQQCCMEIDSVSRFTE